MERYTILKVEVFEEEGEVKIEYVLPHILDDNMIDLYKSFFEGLCEEIAKVPGSEKLVSLIPFVEVKEDDESKS